MRIGRRVVMVVLVGRITHRRRGRNSCCFSSFVYSGMHGHMLLVVVSTVISGMMVVIGRRRIIIRPAHMHALAVHSTVVILILIMLDMMPGSCTRGEWIEFRR